MSAFPVAIELEKQKVIILGSGTLAAQRINSLINTGAIIHVYGPYPVQEILDFMHTGQVTYYDREITESDFCDVKLVFVTDVHPFNLNMIQQWCHQHHAWIHVADVPSSCDFYAVSQLRRGDLVIGVSTSGLAPSLARRVRMALEPLFDSSWGDIVRALSHHRRHHSSPWDTVSLNQLAQHYIKTHLMPHISSTPTEAHATHQEHMAWQEKRL
ncbi:precorrin-2 dehydrogenase/sirohydrochlorin ferrochelatase family protein [Sulfobacillus thermosulfidooxidans]|uniref:precorrin-2 dehydrogenase/sirohydrochlorin ferrochelatase family protein n=1 Tax=Sulfobacillus thermosulfidooxidans TaxID=28034 RepID=UPI0006B68A9F|nr:bifunctional precorrin-2 dehydrogenase/sirohydrochlorin ferrochelatase [Sulfobacillus thermosulfidooxidans]